MFIRDTGQKHIDMRLHLFWTNSCNTFRTASYTGKVRIRLKNNYIAARVITKQVALLLFFVLLKVHKQTRGSKTHSWPMMFEESLKNWKYLNKWIVETFCYPALTHEGHITFFVLTSLSVLNTYDTASLVRSLPFSKFGISDTNHPKFSTTATER